MADVGAAAAGVVPQAGGGKTVDAGLEVGLEQARVDAAGAVVHIDLVVVRVGQITVGDDQVIAVLAVQIPRVVGADHATALIVEDDPVGAVHHAGAVGPVQGIDPLPQDHVHALTEGRAVDAVVVGQGHGDVIDAVAVVIARRGEVGLRLADRGGRQDRRRQNQRAVAGGQVVVAFGIQAAVAVVVLAGIQHPVVVAVLVDVAAEVDACLGRAGFVEVVADTGDEVVEAVTVDVAERDHRWTEGHVHRLDGQRGIIGGDILGGADHGRLAGLVEVDLVAAHERRLADVVLAVAEAERRHRSGGIRADGEIALVGQRQHQAAVVVEGEHPTGQVDRVVQGIASGLEGRVDVQHQVIDAGIGIRRHQVVRHRDRIGRAVDLQFEHGLAGVGHRGIGDAAVGGGQVVGPDLPGAHVLHVQDVVVRHAAEFLHRQDGKGLARIAVGGGEQGVGRVGVLGTRELGVLDAVVEDDVEHVARQQRAVVAGKLFVRIRVADDVVVAAVALVQGQAVNGQTGFRVGQEGGEVDVAVDAVAAVAADEFIGIGRRRGVAGQQVGAGAAEQQVITAATGDEVGAAIAVDDVVVHATIQLVGAVAAADQQLGEQAALFEIAFLDAPLGIGVHELELRRTMEHVVAGAEIDLGILHLYRLVEDVGLGIDLLLRVVGAALTVFEAQLAGAAAEVAQRQCIVPGQVGGLQQQTAILEPDHQLVGQIDHVAVGIARLFQGLLEIRGQILIAGVVVTAGLAHGQAIGSAAQGQGEGGVAGQHARQRLQLQFGRDHGVGGQQADDVIGRGRAGGDGDRHHAAGAVVAGRFVAGRGAVHQLDDQTVAGITALRGIEAQGIVTAGGIEGGRGHRCLAAAGQCHFADTDHTRAGVDAVGAILQRLRRLVGDHHATRHRLGDEFLVGLIPDQGSELVTVQDAVVTHRHLVRHRPAQAVVVATQEQHAVVAGITVQAVDEGRDVGLAGILGHRQFVRDQLEGVVTLVAEQQVRCLPVQAARDHVVAGPAEDPVLAHATLEHVIAGAAEDHVLAHAGARAGQVDGRRRGAGIQHETEAVNGRHQVGRGHLEQVIGVLLQARQGNLAIGLAGQVEHGITSLADAREQLIGGLATRFVRPGVELALVGGVDGGDDLRRRAGAALDGDGQYVAVPAHRLGAGAAAVDQPDGLAVERRAVGQGLDREAVVRPVQINDGAGPGVGRAATHVDLVGAAGIQGHHAAGVVAAGFDAQVVIAGRQPFQQQLRYLLGDGVRRQVCTIPVLRQVAVGIVQGDGQPFVGAGLQQADLVIAGGFVFQREDEPVDVVGVVQRQVGDPAQVGDVVEAVGIAEQVVVGGGQIRAIGVDGDGVHAGQLGGTVQGVDGQAQAVDLGGAAQGQPGIVGRRFRQAEGVVIDIVGVVHGQSVDIEIAAQHQCTEGGAVVLETQLVQGRAGAGGQLDGGARATTGGGQGQAAFQQGCREHAADIGQLEGLVEIGQQVDTVAVVVGQVTRQQHLDRAGAVDGDGETGVFGDAAVGRRQAVGQQHGASDGSAIDEAEGSDRGGVIGRAAHLDHADSGATGRGQCHLAIEEHGIQRVAEAGAGQGRVQIIDQILQAGIATQVAALEGNGARRLCIAVDDHLEAARLAGEAERVVAHPVAAHQDGAAQRVGRRRNVVAAAFLGGIRQDGRARGDLDTVVASAGIDPDRLLHGRADVDHVVTVQGVDDDGDEIAFLRQQVADHLLLPVFRRGGIVLGAGLALLAPGIGGDLVVGRVPDEVAVLVGGVEVQLDLCGKGVVAVVLGQASDQMGVGQQARLGDEIDRDHVVGVGAAVVPDLVGFLGVFLPAVAGQAAVQGIEGAAVGAVQGIAAAVAVHEVEAGATIEFVVVGRTEQAVEPGILELVQAVAIVIVESAGFRVDIDAELADDPDRGQVAVDAQLAADLVEVDLVGQRRGLDGGIDVIQQVVDAAVVGGGGLTDGDGGLVAVAAQGQAGAGAAGDAAVQRCHGAGLDHALARHHVIDEAPLGARGVAGRRVDDGQLGAEGAQGDGVAGQAGGQGIASRHQQLVEPLVGQGVVDRGDQIVDVGVFVGAALLDGDVDGAAVADDHGEVGIGGELPGDRGIAQGRDGGDAVAVGHRGALAVLEAQLGPGGIVGAADVRVLRPGEQAVAALAADQVVVALAAEQPVIVAGQALARAAVAEQAVVAAVAVQGIAAEAAIETVTAVGALQGVVAGSAVEHADPVVAARAQRRDVDGVGAAGEAEPVVAAQAGNPELFDQRHAIGVAPGIQEHVGAVTRGQGGDQLLDALLALGEAQGIAHVCIGGADGQAGLTAIALADEGDLVAQPGHLHLAAEHAVLVQGVIEVLDDDLDVDAQVDAEAGGVVIALAVAQGQGEFRQSLRHAAFERQAGDDGHFLAQLQVVVQVGAFDQQDVGGVVVEHVAFALVAVVALDDVTEDAVGQACIHQDHVDAGAAVQFIVAVLALDPVGVGAAPEHVVAAATEQLVLAAATIEPVYAAHCGGIRVLGIGAGIEPVTGQEVGTLVTEQVIGANTAIEEVVAGATVHLAAGQQCLVGLLLGAGRTLGVGIAIQEVDPGAAPHALAELGPGAAVAEQAVAAVVTVELVDAAGRPGPGRLAFVVAVDVEVATQDVVVAAAANHVIAVAAGQVVVAGTAVEVVVAAVAIEFIVAAAAEQPVVVGAAEQGVLAVAGSAFHGLAVDRHRCDPRHGKAGRELELGGIPVQRILETGGEEGGLGDVLVTTPQQVVAGIAVEGVVALVADEDIVAAATPQQVRTQAAVDIVAAAVDGRCKAAAVIFIRGHRGGDEIAVAIARGEAVVAEDEVGGGIVVAADQGVVAGAAEDHLAAQVDTGVEGAAIEVGVVAELYVLAVDDIVAAGAVVDGVDLLYAGVAQAVLDVGAVAEQEVVPFVAGNHVAAIAGAVAAAGTTDDDIDPRPAGQGVAAAVAGRQGTQHVTAVLEFDAAVVAEDLVGFVARAAVDGVVAGAADDTVLALGAVAIGVVGGDGHAVLVDERRALMVDAVVAAHLGQPALDGQDGIAGVAVGVTAVTEQEVVALVTLDDVAATAGHAVVAAGTADDQIVALAGLDTVAAAVVPVAAVDVVVLIEERVGGLRRFVEGVVADDDAIVAQQDVDVVVVTGTDQVVAGAAEDHVALGLAEDPVIAAGAGEQALDPLDHVPGAALDIAMIAEQDVHAAVAIDHVIGVAAQDQILAGIAVEGVVAARCGVGGIEVVVIVRAVAQFHHGAERIIRIGAADAVLPGLGQLVGQCAQRVGANGHAVVAQDAVIARGATNFIVARAAEQDIVAVLAVDQVVVARRGQDVALGRLDAGGQALHHVGDAAHHVGVVTQNQVVAAVAVQGVSGAATVAAAANDEVVARTAGEGIGAAVTGIGAGDAVVGLVAQHAGVVADQGVVIVALGAALDGVGATAAEDGVGAVIAGGHVDGIVASVGGIRAVDLAHDIAAVTDNIAVVAQQGVGAAAAPERIAAIAGAVGITAAAEDVIIARATVDGVAAAVGRVGGVDIIGIGLAVGEGGAAVVAEDEVDRTVPATVDAVIARAADEDVRARALAALAATVVGIDDVVAAEAGGQARRGAGGAQDDAIHIPFDEGIVAQDDVGAGVARESVTGHWRCSGVVVGLGTADDQVVAVAAAQGVAAAVALIR